MFQTDICLVLDQMIEGGREQKRGPENRGWMGDSNMERAARAT